MRRRSDDKGRHPLTRLVLGVLGGIVAWIVVASILNRGLRLTVPAYAAAELDMTFTLPMMAARLAIGALASLAGGVAAGRIDRPGAPSVWTAGVVLLAAFIPEHVTLWHVFPIWYHLTFLVSLLPLTLLGSLLARQRAPQRSSGDAQEA